MLEWKALRTVARQWFVTLHAHYNVRGRIGIRGAVMRMFALNVVTRPLVNIGVVHRSDLLSFSDIPFYQRQYVDVNRFIQLFSNYFRLVDKRPVRVCIYRI